MAKRATAAALRMDGEKQFLKLFGTLANSTSTWQAWEDLMAVMACSISNAVDRTKEHGYIVVVVILTAVVIVDIA